MEYDTAANFEQLKDIFKDNFKSPSAKRRMEIYSENLKERMNEWIIETNKQMREIVRKKSDFIDQYLEAFNAEIDEEYRKFQRRQDSGNEDLSEMDKFNNFCHSNKFEERLKLNIESFIRSDLEKRLEIKYEPMTERSDVPPLSPIKRNRFTSSSLQPMNSVIMRNSTSDEFLSSISDSKEFRPVSNENENQQEKLEISIQEENFKVPILINKNRDFSNNEKRFVEYSIDSLVLPTASNLTEERVDNQKLLSDYQDLVKTKRFDSIEASRNVQTNGFLLESFDHEKFSIILLKEFDSELNSMASSTRTNELILFNSKLRVVLALKHEENDSCRERSYFEWKKEFDPRIVDICYCEVLNQYLIITENRNIYLLDPSNYSISEMNKIKINFSFNRIHSVSNKVFFIGNQNKIVECEFNEKNLQAKRQIIISNNDERPEEIPILLDVAATENFLFIVYTNRNDQIRARILRTNQLQTLHDFEIDRSQPIDRKTIRIELIPNRTAQNKNSQDFLFLNGNKKSFQIITVNENRILQQTETIQQQRPTNCAFLADGRLVVLHDNPRSFISLHKRKTQTNFS